MMLPANFLGETCGTFFLALFGTSVNANILLKQSKGKAAGWMTISAGWGFAVMLGIFVAQSAGAPNADLNPAVSLARYVLVPHVYTPVQLLLTMLAQLTGAFFGAITTYLVYLPHFALTDDKNCKLAVFATQPAVRVYRYNFLCEFMATAILVVGIGAITGWIHVHLIAAGLGPFLVGLLVWAIGLSLGGPTGYAINPARDLGPRLAHALLPIAGKGRSDWAYAWIPIAAPLSGALLGALLWIGLFR